MNEFRSIRHDVERVIGPELWEIYFNHFESASRSRILIDLILDNVYRQISDIWKWKYPDVSSGYLSNPNIIVFWLENSSGTLDVSLTLGANNDKLSYYE